MLARFIGRPCTRNFADAPRRLPRSTKALVHAGIRSLSRTRNPSVRQRPADRLAPLYDRERPASAKPYRSYGSCYSPASLWTLSEPVLLHRDRFSGISYRSSVSSAVEEDATRISSAKSSRSAETPIGQTRTIYAKRLARLISPRVLTRHSIANIYSGQYCVIIYIHI